MCIRRIILNIFDYHMNNLYIFFNNDIKQQLYEVLFYFLQITNTLRNNIIFFKINQINSNFLRKAFGKWKKDCTFINYDIQQIIIDNKRVNCTRCVDFPPWFFWRLKQIFHVFKCMDTFFDTVIFNILGYWINCDME